jgi:2-polyprenyl-3-methyl-5-hydroxy-6-metoxy-1,4-benzoquinol methylase
MEKPDTSKIDQAWPEADLEHAGKCAYCGSAERTLAYKDVQDWSFYCAPGKWTYWDCTACKSLYLDPRPTQATIGAAYGSYYTHAANTRISIIKKVKEKIINEYLAFKLNVNIKPRLNIPASLSWVLYPIKYKVPLPFGFKELAELPKGKMLDVGCGNGDTVFYAKQIGWQAKGIELDPVAVNASKSRGLDIVEGTYECLSNYSSEYDCVVCSHVLEHVYDPVKMLQLLSQTLKSNGVLILSLPNAPSHLRRQFGAT